MKVNDMYPSKYLSGADLRGPVQVKIKDVVQVDVYDRQAKDLVKKWAVVFDRASKLVLLHKALAYQIADAVRSEDTENWKGKEVILYPQQIRAFGKDIITIRARGVAAGDGGLT